jgi:membrane-bound lytic murein transglycosylase D
LSRALPRRLFSAFSCLALLTGCQQAVRPAAPDVSVSAALPEPVPTEAPALSVVAPELDPTTLSAPVSPLPAMGRGGDVFARINQGLGPEACAATPSASRWRNRYAAHPAEFSRQLESVLPLLDFVSIEVERSGLPAEFAFIPLIESWYRPGVVGPGGPAGMWQMISSTARNHGIHIRPGYDGRLSPVESTRAALSYLKTLQRMFGDDWQAIVMAYNAGEGRIQKAFKRAGSREVSASRRKPHGLSNITYDYVARLQALSCLIAQPGKHGLSLPTGAAFVPVVPLLLDPDVKSLDQFARAQGQDPAQLRSLNPGFKGGRVVAGVPRLVLTPTIGRQVPAGQLASIAMADSLLAMDEGAASAETADEDRTHQVRSGESLWSIARKYRVTIDQLRELNRLGARTMVRPGQLLKLAP